MNNIMLGEAPVSQPVVSCRKPESETVMPSQLEAAPKECCACIEREEAPEITGLVWPFFS